MKNIFSFMLLFAVVFPVSCNQPKEKATSEAAPRVQVKVTTVSQGIIPDYLNLTGKTIYLSKIGLVAPINGYITKVSVNPGDMVTKGRMLFVIKSREAYALESGSGSEDYGTVYVKAPSGGVIMGQHVFKSPVYIDKGSKLCDIVETGSLYVEANIPYEFIKYAKQGNKCNVLLADSSKIEGTFYKVLPEMDEQSQTVKVLAHLSVKKVFPENMIVTVLINKGTREATQVLPKSSVLTDALMTKFWVMKLVNDSIAKQIFVKPGAQSPTQIEILSPTLNPKGKIISLGAYGLEDGALVEVME